MLNNLRSLYNANGFGNNAEHEKMFYEKTFFFTQLRSFNLVNDVKGLVKSVFYALLRLQAQHIFKSNAFVVNQNFVFLNNLIRF